MRLFIYTILMLLPALSAQAEAVPRPAPPANLTILADEEMLLPLAQLVRSYATQTSTPCSVIVKHADEAAQQIEQGLEAHLIITANQALIDRLTAQGLTDVTSRRTLARTQLALVTAGDLSQQAMLATRVSFAATLAATPDLAVLVNAPGSYEGERAGRLLSGHSFSAALSGRIAVQHGYDELLETLRDSEALGLILAAKAAIEPDLHVLALLPEDTIQPVTFESVILGSESMGAAKNLANYLSSPAAQQVFATFGFQTPADYSPYK